MKYKETDPEVKKTFAYQMFGKRCRDLTKEERRMYYTALQKKYRQNPDVAEKCRERAKAYYWRGKTPRTSFVSKMFGKKYRDLTNKERSIYQKVLRTRTK